MINTYLYFYLLQELCAQYWGEGRQTYDDIEVQVTDVNCCPRYTIRAFDVTHLKVEVSLQITKGSFTSVLLIIDLAQRKRRGSSHHIYLCCKKLKYFCVLDQLLIAINATNCLEFTTQRIAKTVVVESQEVSYLLHAEQSLDLSLPYIYIKAELISQYTSPGM